MSSGIKKINILNNYLDIGPIIGNIIIDKKCLIYTKRITIVYY